MKIGLAQYSPVWENKEENSKKILKLLAVDDDDIDLLIFPEMTLTGFTMNASKFAEGIDGYGFKFFIELSSKRKINIFAGLIEKDNGKYFNSLVHFDDNGLIKARYKKIHPYSKAEEDKNYSAGNELVVTDVDHNRIGLSVCYDLRFPELYRQYVKKDISILVDIANWPVPRIEHWKTLLRARAIENQAFMIGVNRVGKDPFNEYNGNSTVYDPMGKEIVLAGSEEKIITCTIDIDIVNETRNKLPFLNDMKLI